MKRIFILFPIFLLTFASQSWGSSAVKLGVVDLQKVVSECKAGVNARAKLQKRTEELNGELKTMVANLEKEKSQFDKDASRLSEDARLEREKQLQKMAREIKDRQRDAQEEVKQQETDSLRKIVERINSVMDKIGSEEGYSAILDKKNGVFYSSKSIDITSQLIKRIDSEYGR